MNIWNKLIVDKSNFNENTFSIKSLGINDSKIKSDIKDVLEYIYTDKINTCPKSKLRRVERYLDLSEILLANTLTNYTNDTKGRLAYGENAIKRAKDSNYSCEICGENDVRCLEIDHKDGDRKNTSYDNLQCLCGSCHNKKTRLERLKHRFAELNDTELLKKLNLRDRS